jgi:hypothetical protein
MAMKDPENERKNESAQITYLNLPCSIEAKDMERFPRDVCIIWTGIRANPHLSRFMKLLSINTSFESFISKLT